MTSKEADKIAGANLGHPKDGREAINFRDEIYNRTAQP